ncbi:hypothetical protein LCGC14_2047060 [marine sediment metagenome]|uniref:Uncharacterized protein n=1 Tax=marine sediment metagenome TaxID=412755 RepID=A0A0F9FCP2_9ZZZZ
MDPDSFDKVNFVIDAWTTGCDAPWYIYVETLKPALLKAFITLITFGWDDVLRGYFRPRGLYKRRTAKRKGKWAHRLPRFPEIGNTLGHHLPGASEVKGTKWSTLGKTLWRIDGAMEQIRFYWLVASIVEDLAFDWTSLLYESYWCIPDPPGRFSYSSPGFSSLPDNAWVKPGFGVEDYEEAPPAWTYDSGSSGSNGCTVTSAFVMKKHPAFPPPQTLTVRIIQKGTGFVFAETGPAEADAAGDVSVPVSGAVPPFTVFQVRVKMTGTPWALYGDGVVVGTENLT